MSELNDAEVLACRLALATLGGNSTPSTLEIGSAVNDVLPIAKTRFPEIAIDSVRLCRHIESLCNVWVEAPSALSDPKGHADWLSAKRRGDIKWHFWSRYRRYLEDYKEIPPNTVRNVDEVTDLVLSLLEDPVRQGPWDQRGMVVGQVQSGKTSNYIGLISKAADAGYRLIVVLAGVHNSLRSQTQFRLDEGFLGFDTQKRMSFDRTNVRIGVGQMPGAGLFIAHALTNSADDGDFKLAIARNAGVMVGGGDPVVLVVKKYKSVLQNLIKYATAVLQQPHPTTGALVVRDVPLLVIDDEADHASVNTAPERTGDGEEVEPRAINRLIRELLACFEKSAYVGYTATPFANIFIKPPTTEVGKYGEDLFPRSFIVSLKAPSDYLGPARVFGLPDDWRAGTEATEGLPVVRPIGDYNVWMPDKHKKDLEPGNLPDSLKEALKCFILACAARRARGQTKVHNSMLIHVTRFTDVQGRVAEKVEEEIAALRRRLLYGEGGAPDRIRDELERLWASDFEVTTRQMGSEGTVTGWKEVARCLDEAVTHLSVRKINGKADDVLAYFDHPEGVSVIAVGGDKLSRGLTLEGLTVSYYLRASRMYDTLMQMGRWFGYRPGYADLCRLYTTLELKGWYEHIALADAELRREFEYMRLLGKTPMDYGLRVRMHPDALMVTSRAKMRNSVTMDLSFAGTISETVVFHRDDNILRDNWAKAAQLTGKLGQPDRGGADEGYYLWEEVPAADILVFLGAYRTHESATKAQAKYLSDYIEAQLRHDELTGWSIALLSSQATHAVSHSVGNWTVGLSERGEHGTMPRDSHIAIKRLVNPPDEMLDLTADERQRAYKLTVERFEGGLTRSRRTQAPTTPDGLAIRNVRPVQRGLLLLYPVLTKPSENAGVDGEPRGAGQRVLGIGVSFPASDTAKAISYAVDNVYWEQEISGE